MSKSAVTINYEIRPCKFVEGKIINILVLVDVLLLILNYFTENYR